MNPEEPAHRPQIVRISRWKGVVSSSLPESARERLHQAFLSRSALLGRWHGRAFRRALREVMAEDAPGGLVLLDARLPSTVPPPFDENFEPIELGVNDERLTTLSGVNPTAQERRTRIATRIVGLVLGAVGLVLLVAWMRAGFPRALLLALLAWALLPLLIPLAGLLRGLRLSHWYLVPGGVVVVRPGLPYDKRMCVMKASEAWAAIRVIQAKVPVTMLEIWRTDERCLRLPVTDREATSFLAAWQSRHAPPDERLLRSALLPEATPA